MLMTLNQLQNGKRKNHLVKAISSVMMAVDLKIMNLFIPSSRELKKEISR